MTSQGGAIWFVTGGARSGKSAFAERLAVEHGGPVAYIATMEPLDDELVARVAQHRARRPSHWTTLEAPSDLLGAVDRCAPEACVILDCLSLWVSNRLLDLGMDFTLARLDALERALIGEVDALLARGSVRAAPTILVTNEVGAGVVPETPLGRAFRDLLGRINQKAAQHADRAWLLVAGRALPLPPEQPPLSQQR